MQAATHPDKGKKGRESEFIIAIFLVFIPMLVKSCLHCRGRSHKVGPVAKVGPCPFAVVNNGTGNLSLLALSNIMQRAQMNDIRTTATPFQKCGIVNFILRTFLNIFAPFPCYKTVNIRRPDMSLYRV